jgi:hypothetical protein
MSDDDYHDDDSRGGLWDPDAFSPPPPPARPTLRVIEPPSATAALDHADEAVDAPRTRSHGTLVSLEQFRPTTYTAQPRRSSRGRVAAATALATLVTAAAVGYSTVTSPERSSRHAPTHPAGGVAVADTEHAAATRNVASGHAVTHSDNRSKQHESMRRRTLSTSPKRPAFSPPTRMPTTTQPARTNTSSALRTPATGANSAARVTSAASEFGFEG